MTQKKTSKSKVAIIGLGNIGQVVAANLIKGNRPVILAERNLSKTKDVGGKIGSLGKPMEIPAAIKETDIIVFAVWFDVIKELLNKYASELQGKIVVDPSNPIAPNGKGGFIKAIGEKESAGQILSTLLPKGAKFAKALGTLSAASLASAAHQKPEQAASFYVFFPNRINTTYPKLF